jgi:mono/diheme cytochrome c family protein
MKHDWTDHSWLVKSRSLISALVFLIPTPAARAEPGAARDLERQFNEQVRPLTQRYCGKCHSSREPEGETDLERISTWAEVRRGRKTWQRAAIVLAKGEMPPPEEPRPSPDEMRSLRDWVARYLDFEARENAGDPGRVVMRRLSNVEYTNSVRDLTGLDLRPAREFPIDGAAGEGFTNTGDALVMSPALLGKYLDAAKEIAGHAVLLPDGFRFSPKSTRRDWTDEIIAEIRRFYDSYADAEGKIPLEPYLAATISLREATAAGKAIDVDRLASERRLNARYLRSLWALFHEGRPGDDRFLDGLRARWKATRSGEVSALAAEIRGWQASVWRFNAVGHAFLTPWQEPVSPVVGAVALRLPLTPAAGSDEIVATLTAGDSGDGAAGDFVLWRQPRLEMTGRPPILLEDIRAISEYLLVERPRMLGMTAGYLAAAAAVTPGSDDAAIAALAKKSGLDPIALSAWLDYLGIATRAPVRIEGYFSQKITNGGGRDFIRGWGEPATPNLVANSSDQEARIPGLMKPHSVAVHPSPNLRCGIGWRSPGAGHISLEAKIIDADPNCGNGATWSLERRRGNAARRLAAGAIDNGGTAKVAPVEDVDVLPGDLIVMLIGPRDGNHGCDLTEVDLEVAMKEASGKRWGLVKDVSGDILAGNPHADRFGNLNIWHFFSEPVTGGDAPSPVIPADSLLARWLGASQAEERSRLADQVQRLLAGSSPAASVSAADRELYRQTTSLSGPLLSRLIDSASKSEPAASRWGIERAKFGKRPDGKPIDGDSFCVSAPSSTIVRLPADLVAGRELVVTAELAPDLGAEGTIQPRLLAGAIEPAPGLLPGVPVVARDGSQARQRIEQSLANFRAAFPAALCFRQIVPVDEVVTMVQLYRSDEPLRRLMLDERAKSRLDRLWDELHYVSQDAVRVYQNFDQMLGFASQEGDTAKVESWRKPITEQADALQKVIAASEPKHFESLLRWTSLAFRRPLSEAEPTALRSLYASLRAEKLDHDSAFRLVMARVLVSPEFLYRVEQPGPGAVAHAVSDWELASRLSYFLWASLPDEELRSAAASGKLHEPAILAVQTRRMIGDARTRALATEFGCQWLEVKDFADHDEKSARHFPTFAGVRDDLYEESVRFFLDLFQRDGSVLEILDNDRTFLNQRLAEHYGVPGVKGDEWRAVAIKQYGRGGVLGLGAILARQSGASRTSPILRGNWLLETLLGDRIPRPPKNVPRLPEDEAATDGLTVRQLVERHRGSPQCAGCHEKIDAFGFALEGFDAIGRARKKDLGDRPIDTKVELKDGARFDGLGGLRDYLMTQRKDQFVRNFCKKLLGYSLGRSVQLSDEPLIEEITRKLRSGDYRVSAAVETIVLSAPFRNHRGVDEQAE